MTKPFRPFFLIIIIKNERFFPVCNRNPKWTTQAKKHPNECSNFGKRKRKNNCNMVCSLITKPCYGFQFPIRKCRIRRFVFFFSHFMHLLSLHCFTAWLLVWNIKSGIWMAEWNAMPVTTAYLFVQYVWIRFFLFSSSDLILLVFWNYFIAKSLHSTIQCSFTIFLSVVCGTVKIMKNYFSTTNKQWKKKEKNSDRHDGCAT